MKGYQVFVRGLEITRRQTIIALVTVVILAFPFLPIFNVYEGRVPQSLSNMKSIGLAMLQYAQDNDAALPTRQDDAGGDLRVSWRAALMPYIKAKSAFTSPTDKASHLPDIEHDGFMRSYAVNSAWSGRSWSAGPFADIGSGPTKLDDIKSPSDLIAMVESTAAFGDFNPLFPQPFTQPTRATDNSGHLFTIVSDPEPLTNVLFIDGHVRAVAPESTVGTASTLNPWTVDASPFTPSDRDTALQVLRYGEAHSDEDRQEVERWSRKESLYQGLTEAREK